MPATIRSGRSPTRPSSAKRTQSTGVPSVAKPREPSRSSTSVTVSERSMVMPRPTALRFESGAMTETSPTSSSAFLAAKQAARGDAVVVGEEDAHCQGRLRGPPVSCPDAAPRARIPDRDAAPRRPLLGAARRPAPQGGHRLEPRPSAAVDALGRGTSRRRSPRRWSSCASSAASSTSAPTRCTRSSTRARSECWAARACIRASGPEALEIGYWIRADAVGQGYATESTAALTRVAFEVVDVERVEIRCVPENRASAAIPRKLGYSLSESGDDLIFALTAARLSPPARARARRSPPTTRSARR